MSTGNAREGCGDEEPNYLFGRVSVEWCCSCWHLDRRCHRPTHRDRQLGTVRV